MVITNQTNQDYWFGPLHLPAGVGTGTLTVEDVHETSLYLADDAVADAINYLYANGKITVASQAQPFPRPTGKPDLLHGDGSPEGLVYASDGTLYVRRDLAKVYQKTTMVHVNTGWAIVSEFNESALKGGLYETVERQTVADDLAALASGTLVLCAIDLPGGLLISNITFVAGATAAGTPLNQWFALYDGSLKKLAVTADDTSTAWAANAAKTLAIANGYRTQGSGLFYLGCMVKATTVPTLSGVSLRAGVAGLTPKLCGTSTGGLTAPATAPDPAAALTTVNAIPYAYVS